MQNKKLAPLAVRVHTGCSSFRFCTELSNNRFHFLIEYNCQKREKRLFTDGKKQHSVQCINTKHHKVLHPEKISRLSLKCYIGLT